MLVQSQYLSTQSEVKGNHFDLFSKNSTYPQDCDSTIRNLLKGFDHLKTWRTESLTASLYRNHDGEFLGKVRRPNGDDVLIQEVTEAFNTILGIPVELRHISSDVLKRFLDRTYIAIVPYDQKYKLYINQELRGGISLTQVLEMNDHAIVRRLRDNLGDFYTRIEICEEDCEFDDIVPIPARKITLTPTRSQTVIRGSFTTLLAMSGHVDSVAINESDIQSQLTYILCNNQGDRRSIIAAYEQAKTIELYLALLGNDVKIKTKVRGQVARHSSQVGSGLKAVLTIAGLVVAAGFSAYLYRKEIVNAVTDNLGPGLFEIKKW